MVQLIKIKCVNIETKEMKTVTEFLNESEAFQKISKVTTNHAKKRGFEITVWKEEKKVVTEYAIWFLSDDDEPAFILSVKDDGLFLNSNMQIDKKVWEELPYWIKTEQQLRKVLDFIHSSTK